MSDLDSGTFFGLIVKPNKRYDSKVKETFRLSKACIEPSTAQDKVTSLYVEYESEEYIIANFDKKNLNENLDLGFSVGETVAFKVEGPGTVHLTGNIESDPDLMDTMMEESDEESELDESLDSSSLKRKKGDSNSSAKKMKVDKPAVNGKDDDDSEDESEEDSDDSDEGETTLGDLDSTTNFAEEEESEEDDSDDDDDDDEDEDEEEEVSEDEDESEEEEETPSPKKNGDLKQTPSKKKKEEVSTPKTDAKASKQESKTPKQDGKTPKKDGKTPKADVKTPKQEVKTPKPETKTPKSDVKTPKQEAKTPKQDGKTPNPEAKTPKQDAKAKDVNTPKSVKKTVKGGIQIEELKEGSGPECKPGKAVGMYYSGRLKSNNKQFDACISGKPFKFKLGKGEVIKGWDIGVAGLKVGGKRRLTIPPNMGYGSSGAPPDIPPNSTLVFDVECKYVH